MKLNRSDSETSGGRAPSRPGACSCDFSQGGHSNRQKEAGTLETRSATTGRSTMKARARLAHGLFTGLLGLALGTCLQAQAKPQRTTQEMEALNKQYCGRLPFRPSGGPDAEERLAPGDSGHAGSDHRARRPPLLPRRCPQGPYRLLLRQCSGRASKASLLRRHGQPGCFPFEGDRGKIGAAFGDQHPHRRFEQRRRTGIPAV